MSYPLSSDVASGDITAAAHYNNLRADALRFGQPAADAVNIGSMFEFYESKLNIIRLNTTQLRVEASAVVPVSLVISGYPVRAVANVDLAAGDVPSGAAADWFVFANRANSSTTFTLSVSTSPSEAANQRRIGKFYWNGTAIEKDSIQTELSLLTQKHLYFKEPMPQCGRLSASTNDPVPNLDISSTSTIYFTPYKGNRASLYVPGYGWRVYSFSELTLDISGYSTGKNYDIFLYNNAGTLTLEGVVWSNDTVRATALVNQDGRWVKNGSLHKLYLGTIRCNGNGVTADTAAARLVWNYYNRIHRSIKVIDTTQTWTYATNTWRPMNNNAANKFDYVCGVVEDCMSFVYLLHGYNAAAALNFCNGIGFDSPSAATIYISINVFNLTGSADFAYAAFNGLPSLGYHYLQLLETVGTPTVTFSGKATNVQTGAHGWILA